MKAVFCLLLGSYVLIVSGCGSKTEAAVASVPEEPAIAKTDSSLLQKAFVKRCNALEIIPVDESATDTSLLRFIIHLKKIVSQKNAIALLDLIGPNTVTSHGGGMVGKKDFIKQWQLEKDPSASEVWTKLERVMNLGGCFTKKNDRNEFIMPYLQASRYFEGNCTFDRYTTYVCLGPETSIYENPDKASKVIARLNYRILETEYDSEIMNSFVPVHTVDQSVQGFAHQQDVYLCADYMLVIGKDPDGWNITAFNPYD